MYNKNSDKKIIKKTKLCKKIAVILTAAVFAFCLTSCGQDVDSYISGNRPVITVGSSDYPPFIDLDNNGDPTGLDMDILKEAFDRIGYDIQLVTISWEEKDELLESGEIDCVTGGFTVEGREDDYLWIGPYMSSNQVVVVNSTSDIKSLQDLQGKKIAVQSTAIGEEILLEHSNPNIPEDVQVFSYEDNMLPFAALGCDYVDALVADEPVVVQYMKDYDTLFAILDEPVMYAEVGTAFAKNGDTELCAKANAAIEEMRNDGTLEEIINSYMGDENGYSGGEDLEK